MTPKWNPILVEEDLGVTEVFADGRMMPGLNIAAQDEDVEQVRTGYRCIRCWEPQESPWPRACFLCGFPIGEHQAEHFARAYKGRDTSLRTGPDLEAAADAMEERQARRAFENRTGIKVVIGKSLKKAFKN